MEGNAFEICDWTEPELMKYAFACVMPEGRAGLASEFWLSFANHKLDCGGRRHCCGRWQKRGLSKFWRSAFFTHI